MTKISVSVLKVLEKFLKSNWKDNTPEELVILWNQNYSKFQIDANKILGHLEKMKLKVPKYEILMIKKSEENYDFCSSEELMREQRIRTMTKRASKNLDIWTGKPLEI